jgi:hypothetical protein
VRRYNVIGRKVRVNVRTERQDKYTEEGQQKRRDNDNQVGWIAEQSDSRGLCFGVRFEDGDIAYFEPDEVRPHAPDTICALCWHWWFNDAPQEADNDQCRNLRLVALVAVDEAWGKMKEGDGDESA